MKLKELKVKFASELSGTYPSEEVQSFFSLLSEYFLNYTRLETAMNRDTVISEENLKKFENAILKLKQSVPIQYIIGQTEFYGLPFKVNSHTLIPRPETEALVDWIISENRIQNSQLRVLDIGTGTGCIAVALAKNLNNAKVSALDISSDVLEIASENSIQNKVTVDFFKLDILKAHKLPTSYDVIVSNPPYVRELEKENMQLNVLEHEPGSALFVRDHKPLIYYQKIAQIAFQHLNPNGKVYFEINEYLGMELRKMFSSEGFSNIEIRKDIFGKDRMLRCDLSEYRLGTA